MFWIFESGIWDLYIKKRLKLRSSTNNCLGISSHTGTGLGKGDWQSIILGGLEKLFFVYNLIFHLWVAGTTGSVWRTSRHMEPGFGTTPESRLTSSCNNTTLNCFLLLMILNPTQQPIPSQHLTKVGQRGLGWTRPAMCSSQLWRVQVPVKLVMV